MPLDVRRNFYANYPQWKRSWWNSSHTHAINVCLFHQAYCVLVLLIYIYILRKLSINNFKESNGWLRRFLIRTPVQPSFKLQCQGDSSLPQCHAQRMEEIRRICKEFPSSNIYNMDESGLFFRMDPRKTYLSGGETRDNVCCTDFSKHRVE